jgi:hypothetical protein
MEVCEPDMTDRERDGLAAELRKINHALGGLAAGQDAHGIELAEIKARVKETNGRVTALEASRIAFRAVESDRESRQRAVAAIARDSRSNEQRGRDRILTVIVTLVSVAAAAILADVRFF